MLNGGYWKGLKDYYETDYTGVAAGKKAEEYAQEMINGGASFLDYDRPFDPDEIRTWVEDTEMNYMGDEEEEEEMLDLFPSINSYSGYVDEIASFFMWKDLDRFEEEIKKGTKEFVDEAIRLNWEDMLEKNPTVAEMFLF